MSEQLEQPELELKYYYWAKWAPAYREWDGWIVVYYDMIGRLWYEDVIIERSDVVLGPRIEYPEEK